MPAPEARLRVADCDITLLGTVAGYVADADRVALAFDQARPDCVALGVPPEDLPALRRFADAPDPAALIGRHQAPPPKRRRRVTDPGAGAAGIESLTHPARRLETPGPDDDAPVSGLDAASMRLLELLQRFGPTRLPSPDLQAAFALAGKAGVPVVAIDLDDATHAQLYTDLVKVRHLLGANRAERRLLGATFADAADAYALAAAWDAAHNGTRPLQRLEGMRERHMGVRLRELAARSHRILAVVPAARFAGIQDSLAAPPARST